uniref:Uncharacterized protein n=1 Tax=Tetraodon nigroviridis TaxID=99883 RepID=H3D571_TETNG
PIRSRLSGSAIAQLDWFLRRTAEASLHERIRFHEPCVVVSETVDKAYMHVLLSDERVFLTEHAPRTLTVAVSFGRVRDIELVNDLPGFLRGKHRQLCQHTRITYVTQEPVPRRAAWASKGQRSRPAEARTSAGSGGLGLQFNPPVFSSNRLSCTEVSISSETKIRVLASAHSETLSVGGAPQPPSHPPPASPPTHTHASLPSPTQRLNPTHGDQVSGGVGSLLSRLLGRERVCGREERAAELHLYSVSGTSTLYLRLQSLWNSFIIRSTLLLDPLYGGRCRALSDSSPKNPPPVLREKTAQVFARLSSALLQEGVGVERLHLLLQQLRRAAHRNLALSRLFWKSRDVCVFLVQTLEESLHGCRSAGGVHTADRLLLSSLVVQTLATLCREADGDPARLDLLSAENAALASRLLLVLCDPATQTQGGDCEVSRLLLTSRALALPFNLLHHLQAWLQEYLDASCSLLFELLLLGHEASRCSPADSLLSVGWILRVLQPHPHLPSFLGYQVKQVVLVLSDLQGGPLSPAQAVLLYQRCGLLLACLQHNNQLSQHLRSHFREEFRYFVKPSCAEEKLPPHYPIRRPTVRLVEELLRRSR